MVYFIYHEDYYSDIGVHVFPTVKFKMIYDRLKQEAGIEDSCFIKPEPASREMLEWVHTSEYLDDLENLRQTPAVISSELPISDEIVYAYKLAAGGTVEACKKAVETGCAVNLTGGFHHAFAHKAEGFCYINDIAVGIRYLQKNTSLKKFMVIDCDLHQGNGTAAIFLNDPDVFTFSIHQEHLYPMKQKSDMDIGLDYFTNDAEYMAYLHTHIPGIIEQNSIEFIIYVAGADPFQDDQLGNLMLTKEGLTERDKFIFTLGKENSIPVVPVLAGGYAQKISDTVDIHYRMCVNAMEIFE